VLYASRHAGETAQQIKAAMLTAVAPNENLTGKTATGGQLDASKF
jgi:hypothetical protein